MGRGKVLDFIVQRRVVLIVRKGFVLFRSVGGNIVCLNVGEAVSRVQGLVVS